MFLSCSEINYAIIKRKAWVIWVKVFKNGPKRLSPTNFTWSILECLDPFLPEVLQLKMISWVCIVGSGLKLICRCRVHSFVLQRLLFNRLAKLIISWTTENSDTSFAESCIWIQTIRQIANKLQILKDKELTPGKRPLSHLSMTNVDRLTQLSVFSSSKNLLLTLSCIML